MTGRGDQRYGGGRVAAGTVATAGLMALLLTVPVEAAVAGTSSRSSCPVTVTIGGGNSGLTLTPDHARVHEGACVLYTNDTASQVSIQINQGNKPWNSGPIDPKGYVQYPATVTGTHDVSVQQTRVLLPASGAGTVRVLAASSPSPSASSSGSASSGHSARTHQAPSGSRRTQRPGPSARATPRRHKRPGKGPRASGRAQLPPLDIPPGATGAPYSVSRRGGGTLPRVAGPQPADPALSGSAISPSPLPTGSVMAGSAQVAPVAAVGSPGTDLALAVGGLLALGQLAALLRVLAAVDNRRRGVGSCP